jgi:hypothetical protein
MTLAFRYPTLIPFTFNCDRNILSQEENKSGAKETFRGNRE